MFNINKPFYEEAGTIIAGILAVTGVATAVEQDKRANKAQKVQKEQIAVDKAQQASSAARERRSQVRKALVARGKIENVAAQSGGTGGTAAEQSIAVAQTQAASNIGQINTSVASKNLQTSLQEDLFKTQIPTGLERGAKVVGQTASLFNT